MATDLPGSHTWPERWSDHRLTCMYAMGEVSGERRRSRWRDDTETPCPSMVDPTHPAKVCARQGSVVRSLLMPTNLVVVPRAGIFGPWGSRW